VNDEMKASGENSAAAGGASTPRRWGKVLVSLVVLGALGSLAGGLTWLRARQAARTNQVALAAEPKKVTVVPARGVTYRTERRYVGTLRAWQQADLGTQFVAAYLQSVRVRPGDRVKAGEVLATLDCRNASAGKEQVAMQVQALEQEHRALASELERYRRLAAQDFLSANELEKKAAESAATESKLRSLRAQLQARRVEADDCVLRAPFSGEVAERLLDPGAFVRPGDRVLTVVDRQRLRFEFDVPERDYALLPVGTPVELHLLATGSALPGEIVRRAPAARATSRSVRLEVDVMDMPAELPVGTTGEVRIEVGDAVPAVEVPLRAAVVRGDAASLFVDDAGVARKVHAQVLGEAGPRLFLAPELGAGTLVVVEGRSSLSDGDPILGKPARFELVPEPAAFDTAASTDRRGEEEGRNGEATTL
jgi:RND family efflux transporter MFP subunit